MFTHEYQKYAKDYAQLDLYSPDFALLFDNIAELIKHYVYPNGLSALDYGCGAGRSTAFLKNLGFRTIGVDHDPYMLGQARLNYPDTPFHLIKSGDLNLFRDQAFNLILSSIVFPEISNKQEITNILTEMRRILKERGTIIIGTLTPETYQHDWSSYICNFPENQGLKSGDKAKLVIRGTDVTLYDFIWTDQDYYETFSQADLTPIKTKKPLAVDDGPYKLYAETRVPLWAIYVLKKAGHQKEAESRQYF